MKTDGHRTIYTLFYLQNRTEFHISTGQNILLNYNKESKKINLVLFL